MPHFPPNTMLRLVAIGCTACVGHDSDTRPEDTVVEYGMCPGEAVVDAATTLPHTVLFSDHLSYYYDDIPSSAVILDETAWEEWWASWIPAPPGDVPTVDFSTDIALAAVVEADHTSCGVELDAYRVASLEDGTALLDVRTYDDSANCGDAVVCDSFAEHLQVVSVLRPSSAAICTRRLDTCD